MPKKLSYWLNNQYGDCVTAEEAFAKAAYSEMTGQPELFVPDSQVQTWAAMRGFLNGAMLTDVMDAMAKSGFVVNGQTYGDGGYQSVDWTNDTILRSAIYQGPVKIGVAAGQLEKVVSNQNGWFGNNFQKDTNLDHCVALCGYGTLGELAHMLGVTPEGIPSDPAYFLFTWDTIGIITQASMIAITGEAWLRTPTTTGVAPVPTPTPTPVPTPPPVTGPDIAIYMGTGTIVAPGYTLKPILMDRWSIVARTNSKTIEVPRGWILGSGGGTGSTSCGTTQTEYLRPMNPNEPTERSW